MLYYKKHIFLAEKCADLSENYLKVWEHLKTKRDYKIITDQNLLYRLQYF
jgi:hypothetical protein